MTNLPKKKSTRKQTAPPVRRDVDGAVHRDAAEQFRVVDFASRRPAHALVAVALGLRDVDPELSDVVEAVWLVLSEDDDAKIDRVRARADLLAVARRLLRERDAMAPGLRFGGRTRIKSVRGSKDGPAAARRLAGYVEAFIPVMNWMRTHGAGSADERHDWIAKHAARLVYYVAHVGLMVRADEAEEEKNERERAGEARLEAEVRKVITPTDADVRKGIKRGDDLTSDALLLLVLRAAGFSDTKAHNTAASTF